MDDINKIVRITYINFYKIIHNPRLYLILVLLFMYLNMMSVNIRKLSTEMNTNVSPWLYPFFMSDKYSITVIMFGIILLFCDAPFIERNQPYILFRGNRTLWTISQILYIVLGSALYFMVVFLLTVICILPNLFFSQEWGKVITSLARTNLGQEFKVLLGVNYSIINDFRPFEAVILTWLLSSLVGIFIGITMFCINLIYRRTAGAAIATVLVLLQYVVVNLNGWLPMWFSPVSWTSLANIDFFGKTQMPPLYFVLSTLLFLCIALSIACIVKMNRKDIEVLKPI